MTENSRRHVYGKSAEPVIQLLELQLTGYVEAHLSNPDNLRLLAGQYRTNKYSDGEGKNFLLYEKLKVLVLRGMDEGLFAEMNIDSAVQFLWTSVFGLSCMLVLRPAFPWQDDIIESSIASIINSLLINEKIPVEAQ